jgi:hypothetical protein
MLARACAAVELLETRRLLAAFLVTSNADDGENTLRAAIVAANGFAGPDTIEFALPDGETTIQLLSPLPAISESVNISGSTQPGFSNSPIVTLDGAAIPDDVTDGLVVTGDDVTISDLIVTNFRRGAGIFLADSADTALIRGNWIGAGNQTGVMVAGNSNSISGNVISGNEEVGVALVGSEGTGVQNVVAGNRIGTNPAGDTAVPNGVGVLVDGAEGARIGGDDLSQRNIIAGNTQDGVQVFSARWELDIFGNLMGVDFTGSRPLGNGASGVAVSGVFNGALIRVGGAGNGLGNVISANGLRGVEITDSINVVVQGNLIGTDEPGFSTVSIEGDPLGNGSDGVAIIGGTDNRVGADPSSFGNVIAGNGVGGSGGSGGDGIHLERTSGNLIDGNRIGIGSDETPLPNHGNGIYIDGDSNLVGGGLSASNLIAFNERNGVKIAGGLGNNLVANHIVENGLLGIDLAEAGAADGQVTPNSVQDPLGPNAFSNFPVLTDARINSVTGAITIEGVLSADFASSFRLDFFDDTLSLVDPSGHGEGAVFVGSTDIASAGAGDVSFQVTFDQTYVSPDGYITATATDQNGNTSEFSLALASRVYDPQFQTFMTMQPVSADVYFGQAATFTAVVHGLAGGDAAPSGPVAFTLRDLTTGVETSLGSSQLVATSASDSQADISVAGLNPGFYQVRAEYAGDEQYLPSGDGADMQVLRETTSVTISSSAEPSVRFAPLTFTAQVAADHSPIHPTGEVEFSAYNAAGWVPLGNVSVVNGVAEVTTRDLPVGQWTVVASFLDPTPSGQERFERSISAPISQTVVKVHRPLAIQTSASTIEFGQDLSALAYFPTINPDVDQWPTGTVTFFDGDVALGSTQLWDGTASFPLSTFDNPLSPGEHVIRAVYGGDADHEAAMAPAASVTVERVETDLFPFVAEPSSRYGEAVTIVASVLPRGWLPQLPGQLSGAVQFFDGDALIGEASVVNGRAELTTSALDVGAHELRLTYSGDANFEPSAAVVSHAVEPAQTSTSLSISPAVATFGDTLTLTATVQPQAPGAGVPEGSVRFFDEFGLLGEVQLVGGSASLATRPNRAGGQQYFADYAGSARHLGSGAAASITLGKAGTAATLTVQPQTSVYGQGLSLNASIASNVPGAQPSGSASFFDGQTLLGTAPVQNGSAALSVSGLLAGQHQFRVVYNGDDNFISATSPTVTHTVLRVNTALSLQSSNLNVLEGQSVTFTATLDSNSAGDLGTGTVTFKDGTTVLAVVPLNAQGRATYTTSALSLGQHTITAIYSGDANHNGSTSAALSQVVDYPTGSTVCDGQTATINFWHKARGQNLIQNFNGSSSSTALGNWLAVTFPNLYGPAAGSANNLTGKNNYEVGDYFQSLYTEGADNFRARIMALALNVYATTASLGGTEGASWGFAVSKYGVYISTWNVGSSGAAFGVANDTTLTVRQILAAINQRAVNGNPYNGDSLLQSKADSVLYAINRAGGIS